MEKFSMMLIWMVLMAGVLGAAMTKGYVDTNRTQQKNGRVTLLQEEFRNDVAGRIGDHVYYSYNVIEGRNLSDDECRSYGILKKSGCGAYGGRVRQGLCKVIHKRQMELLR